MYDVLGSIKAKAILHKPHPPTLPRTAAVRSIPLSLITGMCNYITEGIKHGCGHYVSTRKIQKLDCGSKKCVHSQSHPRPCRDCSSCDKYMGPDREERVIKVTPDYCSHCDYWYTHKGR